MEHERISIQDFRDLSSSWQCSPDKIEKVTTEDLKTLLKEYVLSDQAKSAIIKELKKREPNIEYASINPLDALAEDDKSYPALNFIAGMFKLFGWLQAIVGIIVVWVFLSKEMELYGILVLAASLFSALLSFAYSELILVVTDISSSAFRILKHLKDSK